MTETYLFNKNVIKKQKQKWAGSVIIIKIWAKLSQTLHKGRFGQHLGQRQTATSAPRLEGEEWKTTIYFSLV